MEKVRKSGIECIGDIPWGTHMTLFYDGKEELLEVLIPYFKAGLENNEFCLWITSECLSAQEALAAMQHSMSDFDRYLQQGQINFVSCQEWYLKNGLFSPINSLVKGVEKLKWALSEEYDGVRLTGDIFWLNDEDWARFISYENEVNKSIVRSQSIALCTYPSSKCNKARVIDVGLNHRFALVKEKGKWKVVKNRVYQRMKERHAWKKELGLGVE